MEVSAYVTCITRRAWGPCSRFALAMTLSSYGTSSLPIAQEFGMLQHPSIPQYIHIYYIIFTYVYIHQYITNQNNPTYALFVCALIFLYICVCTYFKIYEQPTKSCNTSLKLASPWPCWGVCETFITNGGRPYTDTSLLHMSCLKVRERRNPHFWKGTTLICAWREHIL